MVAANVSNRARIGTCPPMLGSGTCAAPGNALPAELRAGIIALGQWVDRHSSAVMQGRESAADLIEVNRTMIEALDPGHRGQPGQPGSAPQASSSTSQ